MITLKHSLSRLGTNSVQTNHQNTHKSEKHYIHDNGIGDYHKIYVSLKRNPSKNDDYLLVLFHFIQL